MRDYPAIEISAPVDDVLLAELDGFSISAIEDTPDGLRAFFTNERDRDVALAHLRLIPNLICHPINVSDEDWAARSQAALHAVTVGDITVAPPWTVDEALRARAPHLIVIQPSMGFGTAHHASTRLCLQWLQKTNLTDAAVLDVGTGSGVLAIAALQLGASSVAGIDVDPDALESARENAELNHVGNGIEWREVGLADAASALGRRFNVVCANLTGGLLFRDAGVFGHLAAPGAHLIASGFQPHEAVHVVGAFKAAGWSLEGHIEEEDWVGVKFGFPGSEDRGTHGSA